MARKSEFLQEKNLFYIFTNGKSSERVYFDLLKKRQSLFKVVVNYINGTPIDVVNACIKVKSEANQTWALFDVDESYLEGKLLPALQLARTEEIRVAFSNKAFEVWLISHFEQYSKCANNDELKEELTKIINKNHITGKIKEYKKNDEQLIKTLFIPKYKQAINNAKIVYQTKIKDQKMLHNGNIKEWEMCSSTTVFMLVEALKL